jgi:hypothetical protein
MVIFSSSVIWASTWATRVSTGAFEPTHGQEAVAPAAWAGAVAGTVNAAAAATTAIVAQSTDLADLVDLADRMKLLLRVPRRDGRVRRGTPGFFAAPGNHVNEKTGYFSPGQIPRARETGRNAPTCTDALDDLSSTTLIRGLIHGARREFAGDGGLYL